MGFGRLVDKFEYCMVIDIYHNVAFFMVKYEGYVFVNGMNISSCNGLSFDNTA